MFRKNGFKELSHFPEHNFFVNFWKIEQNIYWSIILLQSISHFLSKFFMRPHLNVGSVIYDQPSNATFSNKIESVQYNEPRAIKEAIRASFHQKLYQELGLEYLHHSRWMRRLCLFYKVLSNKVLNCVYELIPPIRHSFRNPPNLFTAFPCRTTYSKNTFYHVS